MAAATQAQPLPQTLCSTGPADYRSEQPLTPPHFIPGRQQGYPPLLTPSPASTGSLQDRPPYEGPLSPQGSTSDHAGLTPYAFPASDSASHIDSLFHRFSELLDRGLAQTAAKITGDLKADFINLGARIDAIEHKMEDTIAVTNQHSQHISTVQDQLDLAMARIDELENRSRRYNIRIRGLPETIHNVPEAVQDLIKQLIPNISSQHLELDRAHRALGPPRKDGTPRDIIAKPHHYTVKEEVMRKARSSPSVQCMGHPVQIFADLSPSTIQRRRSLKPLLLALTQRDIKYKWAFPFAVKFSVQGKHYAFSSLPEGEKLLLHLKIISQEAEMDTTNAGTNSNKRQTPTSPQSPLWSTGKAKKAKDNNQT